MEKANADFEANKKDRVRTKGGVKGLRNELGKLKGCGSVSQVLWDSPEHEKHVDSILAMKDTTKGSHSH